MDSNMELAELLDQVDLDELSEPYSERQKLLAQQAALAQALRGVEAPQGRMVGRVYVAPNVGDQISAALQQAGGALASGMLSREQGLLLDKMKGGQKSYMRALAGYGKPQLAGSEGEGDVPVDLSQLYG